MHEALLFYVVWSDLRLADGASKGDPVLDSDYFIIHTPHWHTIVCEADNC